MEIEAVLFDIGGVLLEDPRLGDFWKGSDESRILRERFGTGKISEEDFVKEGSKILDVSPEEFREGYEDAYSVGAIEDSLRVYDSVNVPRYIFSDTNPIHAKYIWERFKPMFEKSKGIYFSYEIGIRKSDPESFKIALKGMDVPAGSVLFIDNKLALLDVAKSVGMKALLYRNSEQLRMDLEERGLIK